MSDQPKIFAKIYPSDKSDEWIPSFIWRPARYPKGLAFFTDSIKMVDYMNPQMGKEQQYSACQLGKDMSYINYVMYVRGVQFRNAPQPIAWYANMPVWVDPVDMFGLETEPVAANLHEFMGQNIMEEILDKTQEAVTGAHRDFWIYIGRHTFGKRNICTGVGLRGFGDGKEPALQKLREGPLDQKFNRENVVLVISTEDKVATFEMAKKEVDSLLNLYGSKVALP